MALAATIWGLSSLYYKALAEVPPLEVLSHRTLWCMAFFGAVLLATGRVREVGSALTQRRTWSVLGITSTLIAANWLAFIYAVQSGQALEASLGYYIFPLVAVALGYLVLKERFSALQLTAVGMAAAAVAILTAGSGGLPALSLVMAGTFGFYGLMKKGVPLGPVVSVFVEVLLLSPVALLFLYGAHEGLWTDIGGRSGGQFGENWQLSVMLMLSGPITGAPLILMAYAARRITLGTLGLVQYLNPTLQFFIAVRIFGERFTLWHAAAFALIWTGLALYSGETWRRERALRKLRVRSETWA